MGAFAGSSALECDDITDQINVITLTINNQCNLKCPHCYLQYDASSEGLSPATLEAIRLSQAKHVSIVGMEPLVNKRSAERLEEITDFLRRSGKRVSFITNAINGRFITESTAKNVDYIDVSIDGSPKTYTDIRGAKWSKLISGVNALKGQGAQEIRVLQTITSSNITELPNMFEVCDDLGASKAIFSPFSLTKHQGDQTDFTLNKDLLLNSLLALNEIPENAFFVMDVEDMANKEKSSFMNEINSHFNHRTIFFEKDPVHYGMLRITYDGKLMTPRQGMHTADYHSAPDVKNIENIDDFVRTYKNLCEPENRNRVIA